LEHYKLNYSIKLFGDGLPVAGADLYPGGNLLSFGKEKRKKSLTNHRYRRNNKYQRRQKKATSVLCRLNTVLNIDFVN